MPRPDRQTWLLGIAEAVGRAADCTRRQVGAVIYDPTTFHILSTGYNGRPAGLPGCLTQGACPRGRLSYDELPSSVSGPPTYFDLAAPCDAHHAEDNALRRARERGIDVAGMEVAVTAEPCHQCYALLRHFDVARAVWPDGSRVLVGPSQ